MTILHQTCKQVVSGWRLNALQLLLLSIVLGLDEEYVSSSWGEAHILPQQLNFGWFWRDMPQKANKTVEVPSTNVGCLSESKSSTTIFWMDEIWQLGWVTCRAEQAPTVLNPVKTKLAKAAFWIHKLVSQQWWLLKCESCFQFIVITIHRFLICNILKNVSITKQLPMIPIYHGIVKKNEKNKTEHDN